jgi:hypothetical protein
MVEEVVEREATLVVVAGGLLVVLGHKLHDGLRGLVLHSPVERHQPVLVREQAAFRVPAAYQGAAYQGAAYQGAAYQGAA